MYMCKEVIEYVMYEPINNMKHGRHNVTAYNF